MALSLDSMFLFEIIVEDLKSFIDCKEFKVKCQFGDVFTLHLDNLNVSKEVIAQIPRKRKCKCKTTVRRGSKVIDKPEHRSIENKVKMGQSIIIARNVDLLISNMKNYPMELFLRSKDGRRTGLNHIPWSLNHIDYLKKVSMDQGSSPVTDDGQYNVFDTLTSKRMATLKLYVKLSHLKEKITTQFKSLSDNNQHTIKYNKPKKITSITKRTNATDDVGVIKTLYDGRKKTLENDCDEFNCDFKSHNMKALEKETLEFRTVLHKIDNDLKTKQRYIHLIKSDTTIHKNTKLDLVKSKSVFKFNQEQVNILNYVFGDTGPYGNRVYCVGYFTVENDFTKGTDSSKKSTSEKESNFNKSGTDSPTKSVSSFCSPLIDSSIQECKKVECIHKERELPPKPDERIQLDLTNLEKECCNVTQTFENVVGAMTANMQFSNDPCMCTCECKFGFTKRTTYCTTCGGYENSGEDMPLKGGPEMPFPCPIFHKITKGKSKTPSERSLSEKGCKKFKNKDARFKFNYGYEAPKIGHSHCGMPCTGTMGVVPKNMGWLWNAGDIPGMKVAQGWKPGAISKRLLRQLNKAKQTISTVKQSTPTKKPKKRAKDKPTLMISKKDGQYRIEMQVTPDGELNNEQCSPLIYRIANENNEDRIRKKERLQRRLIREAVANDWSDPFHPEVCEKTCRKAYEQVIGVLPFDPNNPECTCSNGEVIENLASCSCDDDYVSSECSSSGVDWEIQFSPPTAVRHRNNVTAKSEDG